MTTPRRSASAVTLMQAVGGATAPATHSFFPCLEHRTVSVMCGKLGIEKAKYIREGGRAPTKAVFRRAAVTTAAAILYTRLTRRASSVRRGVYKDRFVLTMWFVTVQTIA